MNEKPIEPPSTNLRTRYWSVAILLCMLFAGIIVPVLARSRQGAGDAQCLANLRRIGQGTALYLHDYDQTYPFAWSHDGADWRKEIASYAVGGKDGRAALEVFHCPEDRKAPDPMSYAANAMLAGAMLNNKDTYPPKRFAEVMAPPSLIWAGDTNKNWTRQEGFNDALKDWIRPIYDIPSSEKDDETFAFYRQWLKQRDWTDLKAHPFDCPDGLYLCKYPSFHHGRAGERTGKANFLFADGHAKAFAWGTLRVENFFPTPTTRQLRMYND